MSIGAALLACILVNRLLSLQAGGPACHLRVYSGIPAEEQPASTGHECQEKAETRPARLSGTAAAPHRQK